MKRTLNLTAKQKNVVEWTLKNMVEKGGKTKWEILKEAGYSDAVQHNPSKIYGSKKIIEALNDIWINDSFLALKQKSHLNARKIEIKDTYYSWEEYEENPKKIKEEIEKELEEDMPWSRVIKLIPRITRKQDMYVSVRFSYPEYMVQDKALDKIYKLRWDYAPEKKEVSAGWSLIDLFK